MPMVVNCGGVAVALTFAEAGSGMFICLAMELMVGVGGAPIGMPTSGGTAAVD